MKLKMNISMRSTGNEKESSYEKKDEGFLSGWRFDTVNVDPCSLKPNLARMANVELGQLWMNSPFKDRIVIGQHSLESSGNGDAHLARYQNFRTGRYDGVHLYGQAGCTDYTNSVKSILMMAIQKHSSAQSNTGFGKAQAAFHKTCPQANYQKGKYHPSVQVRNRFDVLNQGNF